MLIFLERMACSSLNASLARPPMRGLALSSQQGIEIITNFNFPFRENFGYISPNWHALPSSDPKYIRKRTAQVQITLQCGEFSELMQAFMHS